MRHLVVALAMALLLVGTTAGAGSTPRSAYVTDFGNGSVLHVNLQTSDPPTHIGVGSSPFGAAILPDGSRVYVTNSVNIGSVSVINSADNSVSSIAVGKYPMGVAVAKLPGGQFRVFVANWLSPTLSVIDVTTNSLITTPLVNVGLLARGVAVHPTLPYLYVTNMGGSGGVTIVRTTDLSIVKPKAAVGVDPFGIAVAPDGSAVYVALEGEGRLAIVDPQSGALMGTSVQVGSKPTGVAVAPDGRHVYVTNRDSNTLSVFDTTTRQVMTVVVGAGPSGVAVSSDGSRVYVANSVGGSLSVLNVATNAVQTIALTGSFPVAVALVPGPNSITVNIDIMPGSDTNPINRKSKGTVTVAILGSTAYDVTTVDPASVRFAGAPVKAKPNGELMASFEDVNGDGLVDLVLHFDTQSLQIADTDTTATLTGQMVDTSGNATPIEGTDTIRVVH